MKGLKISCGVNIIDTPGFNDTRKYFDDRIISQIKELFIRRINHVDAILIVLPLSAKRLTQGQEHVFSSILPMFGDDIKDNIFVTFTHDDSGDEHSCLSLLEKADIPYKGYFRFNNANIFSEFVSLKGGDCLNQTIWNTRNENFSKLFKQLETTRRTTITSSIAVMRARTMLEIQLKALEDVLSVQAQYVFNYKEDMLVVRAIASERPENRRHAIYSRTEPEIIEQYTKRESLNCPTCRKTCHQKCWVPTNKLRWTCEAITNDKCTVCDKKCDVKDHVLSRSVFKVQYVSKLYSGEHVIARQNEREGALDLLQNTLQRIEKLITEINRIALLKNALTITHYIQNIINKDIKKGKEGYENRTQIHENILKHLKKKTITELTMDLLMTDNA